MAGISSRRAGAASDPGIPVPPAMTVRDSADDGADESCRLRRLVPADGLPPYVASSDPAMPSTAVMMNPLGSFPVLSIFPTNPATKPISMVQTMSIRLSVYLPSNFYVKEFTMALPGSSTHSNV